MINSKHLLKVGAAWISIVYAICFAGIAAIPGIRPRFMIYGLHMGNFYMRQNILTFGTFFSGLIIWNVIAMLALGLFAWLYNNIKK